MSPSHCRPKGPRSLPALQRVRPVPTASPPHDRPTGRLESADSRGTERSASGGALSCGIYGRFLAHHWTAHFVALLAFSFFLYFLFLSTYSVNPLSSLYRRRRLPFVAAACAVRCR